MRIMKPRVSIPVLGLVSLFAFTGLGWLIVCLIFKEMQHGEQWNLISTIGITVFSALFIGSSAGILIDVYLKQVVTSDDSVFNLEKKRIECGIKEIYASRTDVAGEFLKIVQDKKVTRIDIIGISLRDFLTGGGILHEIWKVIKQRLINEQSDRSHKENNHIPFRLFKLKVKVKQKNGNYKYKRLKVRLLLLDPRSAEGLFRANIEAKNNEAVGLDRDISTGLAEVSVVQNVAYDSPPEFLQVRLYEHCPFSFMFLTENEVFVEQYYYRDHSKRVNVPIFKYEKSSAQYNEFQDSFEKIWNNASDKKMKEYDLGYASAIKEMKVKNIYRREQQPNYLAQSEVESLRQVQPKDDVRILAITGSFYLGSSALSPVIYLRKVASVDTPAKVKFALVNPVCQSAILRAIADTYPAKDIKTALRGWTWEQHKETKLYNEVHESMKTIDYWKEKKVSFELRLYFGSIASMILLTPNESYIEQYFYGRSRAFEENRTLGGEYPVFHFETATTSSEETVESEILSSTFEVIWNSFSIASEVYQKCNEEDVFNANLEALRKCGDFEKGEVII